MRLIPFLALTALVACGGGKEDTSTTTTPVTFQQETGDTAEPPLDLNGQVGSIAIVQYGATVGSPAGFVAGGLFANDDGGLLNSAGCLLFSDPCTTSYPALGDTITPNPSFDFFNSVTWYDVDEVMAGDTVLALDGNYPTPVFIGFPTSFGTSGGITLDGDFLPYAGSDDFTYATPLADVTPDATAPIVVGPGQLLPITWTPGTVGDVYISSGGGDLTHADDNGAYDYAIDDLGLRAPLDYTSLTLSRETLSTVDASGNTIQVQTSSQQRFELSYRDTDGWNELILGDRMAASCADAAAAPPIGPGQYYGDVLLLGNNHDVGEGNPTTGYASTGNDGVVKVPLANGQQLTVTYRQTVFDASVYLLDDSCDANSPLAGVDDTLDGEDETFSYTATADGFVYLVLDTFVEGAEFSFVLEIQ